MTKLKELEAASWDAYWVAWDAELDPCDYAYDAYNAWKAADTFDAAYAAASAAYYNEIKKTQEESSND
jgi:hypothetical protein